VSLYVQEAVLEGEDKARRKPRIKDNNEICFTIYPPYTEVPCSFSYQAHLASTPSGHLLTAYFLLSSKKSIPNPKAAGKKKCSAGTLLVRSTLCNCGMYSQNMAITKAKAIAGKR
jgi:hypothetical protein